MHLLKTPILTLIFCASFAVIFSCGSDTDTQNSPGTCEPVELGGVKYCVWKQKIIVETGYECPAEIQYFHNIDDIAVCSEKETPPSKQEAQDLLKKLQEPNMCSALNTSYTEKVNAFDTSCTIDTDCKAVTGHCGLGQCYYLVNKNTDATMLGTIATNYASDNCGDGGICGCRPASLVATKCDQGTCVEDLADQSCIDTASAYKEALGALDNTCTQNSDCKGISGYCGLSECVYAVNTNADTTAMDTAITDYQAQNCAGDPPPLCGCQGPDSVQYECKANLCVKIP